MSFISPSFLTKISTSYTGLSTPLALTTLYVSRFCTFWAETTNTFSVSFLLLVAFSSLLPPKKPGAIQKIIKINIKPASVFREVRSDNNLSFCFKGLLKSIWSLVTIIQLRWDCKNCSSFLKDTSLSIKPLPISFNKIKLILLPTTFLSCFTNVNSFATSILAL